MRHHSAEVLFRTHQPALRRHRVPLRLVRFQHVASRRGRPGRNSDRYRPGSSDLPPRPHADAPPSMGTSHRQRRATPDRPQRTFRLGNHRPRRHRNRSIQHQVDGRRPRRQPTGIWQPCRDSGAHDGSQWQQSVRLDPTSPGAHTITLIVDVDTFIAESNNSNNSRTVKVTAAPRTAHCRTPIAAQLTRGTACGNRVDLGFSGTAHAGLRSAGDRMPGCPGPTTHRRPGVPTRFLHGSGRGRR